MKILVMNGPNLNLLGQRETDIYGKKTLEEINDLVRDRARDLGIEVITLQSNHEGALIDFLQDQSTRASGVIINPGALTHYGLSLLDALVDTGLPVVEVHLSNIYAREEWRAISVIAPIARGQISGLGWRGYVAALEVLAAELQEEGR
jgi:3-dehydroquinate dehydratase-2